jgi:hypothetical protein
MLLKKTANMEVWANGTEAFGGNFGGWEKYKKIWQYFQGF